MTALQVISIGGTLISAMGKIRQGQAADAAGKYNSQIMYQRAGQERASSQRSAAEKRREARVAQSNAIASAAASGAGATDPTVVSLVSNLAGYGEYESLTKLYEGEENARGLESQGDMERFKGKQAKNAAYTSALAQVAGAGGNMLYQKYGSVADDDGGGLFEDSYAGSEWGEEDHYFFGGD